MDAATPGSLLIEMAKLKTAKPSLQIWLSIGGWTFSDDNTPTQPVFGNIARDKRYREIFANNVLSFLQTYGYDGVDIDWEYPGAPDRGGKPDDVDNFVLLLKEIKAVFDRSGRTLGISLTIPASYWYLKWFDLPGLLEYADFVNLMSYDLHGVWDSNNPIGSRVLAHTNLTEIALAAELLWRVGVKPSQVSLGFGFYGRAFTLQDSSCTKPGCPFKEGARPGVCTDTSGYLAYYEVQDILQKNPDIQVIHDKEAAVKYMAWDKDQWISFDDADTFKQKVEWADKIGFSGSLIWASDLDDYTWSAHKALLGREVASNNDMSDPLVRRMLPGYTYDEYSTEACYRHKDCADLNNPMASGCASGYFNAGYDVSDCGDNKKVKLIWPIASGYCKYAKRICCPSSNEPKYCVWRGRPDSIGDCNGQCQQGEMTVFESKRGGKSELGDKEDESGENKKCKRGLKTFCCGARRFSKEDGTCRWTECNEKCSSDERELAKVTQYEDKDKGIKGCNWYKDSQRYCCKKGHNDVTAFEYCNWVGQGDCGENRCSGSEVTVHTSSVGENGWKACLWNRKKSLCCSPNPKFDMQSSSTMCSDISSCGDDFEFCDRPDVEEVPDDEGDDSQLARAAGVTDLGIYTSTHFLGPRGASRTYLFKVAETLPGLVEKLGPHIKLKSAGYPSPSDLLKKWAKANTSAQAYKMAAGLCVRPSLEKLKALDLVSSTSPLLQQFKLQVEHRIDLQVLPKFFNTAMTRVLPSGKTIATKLGFDPLMLGQAWNKEMIGKLPPLTLPRGALHTINNRMFSLMGSNQNLDPFLLLPDRMNNKKGNLFNLISFLSKDAMRRVMKNQTDPVTNAESLMSAVYEIPGIYQYIQLPEFTKGAVSILSGISSEAGVGEAHFGLTGFQALWHEFLADYLKYATDMGSLHYKNVISGAIDAIADPKYGVPFESLVKYTGELRELSGWATNLTLEHLIPKK
ncbi:symbiotic chitinase [Beauveria brongniartii RCEF 3172]|uniref:chitinase n=1 Tax=Beauveria brongniartii RCEF 3172 TaxID=1081107 RepID=A0A166Z467_9HYPO|nr:symbiotic chitinase [Beauveria brongniartii RCEF 3172]